MATINCPHCGKPTSDLDDFCRHCGKPLEFDETPAASSEEMPDWLQSLRSQAAAASEDEGADLPDWLKTTGALPDETPTPTEPAEDVPDWLKSLGSEAAPAEAVDVPDWLKMSTGHLAPSEPEAPEPPAHKPTAPFTTGEPVEEPLPDWMRELGREPEAPAAPAAEDVPDWLKASTGQLPEEPAAPAPEGEMPDWLKSLGTAPEAPPPPAAPRVTAPFSTPPPEEGEVPEWLDVSTGPLPAPEAAAGPSEVPDWLKAATGELPPLEQPQVRAEPSELPDWLKAATGPLVPGEAMPTAPAGDLPDWLKSATSQLPPLVEVAPEEAAPSEEAAALPAEGLPDWLRQMGQAGTAPLAAQPTETAKPPSIEPGAEPEWLSALRPSPRETGPLPPAPPPSPETPVVPAEAVQGALPAWLAAMRPVEVGTTEPEVDDYEETVGVLTGMRGVLRAEPSVVLPGKSAANVHLLNFTDAQSKAAAMLAAMLASDAETKAAPRRRARLTDLPWERWLVVIALLIGMLIPGFALPGLFLLPTPTEGPVNDTFMALEALPPERPVLIVFDFEPAQIGELGPLADALVAHLVRRGVPLVGVSTSLSGAGLAQDTFARVTPLPANGYTYGVTHLNLGFLPGGPVGIAQFVLSPRSTYTADFNGDNFAAQGGLWQGTVLRLVNSFDDFSAVIVISATPDGARAWVEQTQGRQPQLILAVTAGAEPLVRPYYDADVLNQQRRIPGFLSGPLASTQYETRAGAFVDRTGAVLRWDMLGGGLFTAALLLLFGNFFHGAFRLWRERSRRGRA